MLTTKLIQSTVGATNFILGFNLYDQNRVLYTNVAEKKLGGKVYSTKGRTFHQSIDFSLFIDDTETIFGYCTCIDSHDCQHVAAILLDVKIILRLDEEEDTLYLKPVPSLGGDSGSDDRDRAETAESFCSSEVNYWFSQLTSAVKELKEQPRLKTAQERLVYVIDLDRSGVPRVIGYRARFRKRGTPAMKKKPFSELSYSESRGLLTLEDIGILPQLRH